MTREDTVISIFSALFPPCEIVANTRTHFFSAEKHHSGSQKFLTFEPT